jgi:hypothetical protein
MSRSRAHLLPFASALRRGDAPFGACRTITFELNARGERRLLEDAVSAARAALVAALQTAHSARRGVPHSLEFPVRAFARASREAGIDVAEVLIEVKALVRRQVAADEPIFTPKVVGWTVAGYFAGTGRNPNAEGS